MRERKQPLGRPRDDRVDKAIATAARELIAEHGYAQLTVDTVATRAGVGKAAIYRRYATKQEMIFAVALHDLELDTPPDAGSLRADLATLTHLMVDQLAAPPPGVVPGLLADVHADPALAAKFTATFVAAERRCLVEILDRAIGRGELARRPEPAVVHALLLGPVFAWLFLLLEDRSNLPAFATTVADATAAALTREEAGSREETG
ncbi:TetR/AcrR family transcriptional regulator [Nonomuraea sp. NPDC049129]|uniref:TetR/AcrR family transcriptional regulator n=1 Tax=Nonomuraea sp. NPDC049129 TaxID=3155272 RepID=UPI00340885AC